MTPVYEEVPMRRIAMLIGVAGLPIAATGAVAQIGCDDPAVSVRAGAAPLEGFAVLFQQNGVTFYGRAADEDGTPLARIMIRNGNRFPVEVSYSVLLEYTADSLPRSLGLGRHCAQIPAGQFAVAEDVVPAPPSALRVRNLTIANLAAGQTSAGAPLILSPPADAFPKGGPRSRVAVVPPATPPAARRPTAALGSTPPDRSQAPAVVDSPDAPRSTGVTPATVRRTATEPARARPPVSRPEELGPVRAEDGALGAWALEATHAVFFSLSAIVIVAAGVGLLLPVLAGFALLAALGVGLVRRRVARRGASRPPS
jgi:hypothetical protein